MISTHFKASVIWFFQNFGKTYPADVVKEIWRTFFAPFISKKIKLYIAIAIY